MAYFPYSIDRTLRIYTHGLNKKHRRKHLAEESKNRESRDRESRNRESTIREIDTVDKIIRQRCTSKYLADEPLNSKLSRATIEEVIEAANFGPVHLTASKVHRSGEDDSILPWRFYVLQAGDCRSLRDLLISRGDGSKVPNMLAAASALIQVTWLPNPLETNSQIGVDPGVAADTETHIEVDGSSNLQDRLYDATIENMEHIAAASAAVQNMLLAATVRGIPTYWSSGGALRKADVFSWLEIPQREMLLGSVFLFPEDETGARVVPGKLRDKRGGTENWVKWVEFL